MAGHPGSRSSDDVPHPETLEELFSPAPAPPEGEPTVAEATPTPP